MCTRGHTVWIVLLFSLLLFLGLHYYVKRPAAKSPASTLINLKKSPPSNTKYATATFAGGCFWCMQPPFDKLKGVVKTTVGYTGGQIKNPTYRLVAYGRTKHVESIQVIYNPTIVSYTQLLRLFWRNIDPTAINRQFADIGRHYRTVIYYHNSKQYKLAIASKKALAKSAKFKKPIATELTPATAFYPAETYHQKYYIKKPIHYKRYRIGSGRAAFLRKHWGKK